MGDKATNIGDIHKMVMEFFGNLFNAMEYVDIDNQLAHTIYFPQIFSKEDDQMIRGPITGAKIHSVLKRFLREKVLVQTYGPSIYFSFL